MARTQPIKSAVRAPFAAALIAGLALFSSQRARANEHAAPAADHGGAPAAHGAAAGDHPAEHAPAGGLTERPAPAGGRDARVPRQMLTRLDEEYAHQAKAGPHGAKPGSVARGLLNLAIELTEPTPKGALDESARFLMPPGGGHFDLSTVVGTHRGPFTVRALPRDDSGALVTPNRVYFVPRAKPRALAGETFGDGCGTYLDLTSAFRERFAKRGFDTYTSDQRYLTTLGGTFVFAYYGPSALQVASVTFTDSRYPQLLCE